MTAEMPVAVAMRPHSPEDGGIVSMSCLRGPVDLSTTVCNLVLRSA